MINYKCTGLDDQILKSLDAENPSEDLIKAMNRQGLVQKEITDKNGHRKKVWVKAAENESSNKNSAKSNDESEDKNDKIKETALASEETITVKDWMSEDYFPWSEDDDEYKEAIKTEKDICRALGGSPSKIKITTSDSADNYDDFTKFYSGLSKLPEKEKIGDFSIVSHKGSTYAIGYMEGGLEVIYHK